MASGHVLNEMITYGVIIINSASPVQSCNETDVILKYQGPVYAVTINERKATTYKKRGVVDMDKKMLLIGGYDN